MTDALEEWDNTMSRVAATEKLLQHKLSLITKITDTGEYGRIAAYKLRGIQAVMQDCLRNYSGEDVLYAILFHEVEDSLMRNFVERIAVAEPAYVDPALSAVAQALYRFGELDFHRYCG